MRVRRVLLALLLAPLAACGTNLLVRRWPIEVVGPEGGTLRIYFETRTEHGMLQPQFDHPWYVWSSQALVGLICEPWDWLVSTAAATEAMFSADRRVAGGVIGWLAALTPGVTLVEGMVVGPRAPDPLSVHAGTWRRLVDPSTQLDAARELVPRAVAVEVGGAPVPATSR